MLSNHIKHTHSRRDRNTPLSTEDSVVVVVEPGLPIKCPDVESEVTGEAGEERSRDVGEGGTGRETRRQTGGVIRRGM